MTQSPNPVNGLPETVQCARLDGEMIAVRRERLILRPAAYGIVIHEGKLLLLTMRATGKYHLPGGGVNAGERIEAALRRELREEAGVEVGSVSFAHFEEFFFYYDPSGRAYHGLQFFYRCQPATTALLADEAVDDDAAECPRWVEIASLQPGDFQAHGEVTLALCR